MAVSVTPGNLVRALRLPFITASVLPYVFGAIAAHGAFKPVEFVIGLIAVAATHLSANVMNDYVDARSGADSQDLTYYGFFGGSKLIQEGVLTARFYVTLSVVLGLIAASAAVALAVAIKSVLVLALFALILVLAWSYSAPPLRLGYRRAGEAVIFLLFGAAPVMGGWFIQTGEFPALRPFVLSLPFGFLTAAILLGNEVPDAVGDTRSGKLTLVGLVGQRRGYLLHGASVACGLTAAAGCVAAGYAGPLALLSLGAAAPGFAATRGLRRHWADKPRLVQSSRLTILAQSIVGIVFILDGLL